MKDKGEDFESYETKIKDVKSYENIKQIMSSPMKHANR